MHKSIVHFLQMQIIMHQESQKKKVKINLETSRNAKIAYIHTYVSCDLKSLNCLLKTRENIQFTFQAQIMILKRTIFQLLEREVHFGKSVMIIKT